MQSVATKNRINQITILVFVTFLFYQLSNWVGGFWIPLSAIVIVTPFSTYLTIQKAQNRFIGTIAGLFAAILLQYYIRIFPEQLPVIVVLMAFTLGFVMTKDYKYYIAVVTLAVCLSFSYTNAPYTSFEPSSLFLARLMGVFGAVIIFLFLQTFIFGKKNVQLELKEETDNLSTLIMKKYKLLIENSSPNGAFNVAIEINDAGKVLSQFLETSTLIFDPKDEVFQKANDVFNIKESIVKELLSFNPSNQAPLKAEIDELSAIMFSENSYKQSIN